MRTPLITDSLKKTEIDHKFLISTADLRTYGCGFETCVFKMENGEIDYLDIDRLPIPSDKVRPIKYGTFYRNKSIKERARFTY